MSFEESLVKKKTRKGFIYFIVGIIFIISFMLNAGYFILGSPIIMTRENCPYELYIVCVILLPATPVLFFIGIPLFIKGLVTLAKRKKLTNKERIQKSDIDKDEKN